MKKARLAKQDPSKRLRILQKPSHRYENSHLAMPVSDVSTSIKLRAQSLPHRSLTQSRQPHFPTPRQRQETRKDRFSLGLSKHLQRQTSLSPAQSQKKPQASHRSFVQKEANREISSSRPLRINSLEESHRTNLQRNKFLRSKSKDGTDPMEKAVTARSTETVLKKAKVFFELGQARKSILLCQGVLRDEPENLTALYLCMLSWKEIGDMQRACKYANLINGYNKRYCCESYICLARKLDSEGFIDQAIEKLEQAHDYFPFEDQVHLQIGALFLRERRYIQAVSCLQSFLKTVAHSRAREYLAYAYFKTNQYEKAYLLSDQLSSEGSNDIDKQKYEQIAGESLLQLKRYDEVLKRFQNIPGPSSLYFQGVAHHNLKEPTKAHIVLESALAFEKCEKPLRYLLLVKVIEKDFYEAMHFLERGKHLNIKIEDLIVQRLFIEGVISLMRRSVKEGIPKLLKILHIKQMPSNEFSNHVIQVIHLYLAYGYYCTAQFGKCLQSYEIQKKYSSREDLQKMEYNRTMAQAYIHYERDEIVETKLSLKRAVQISKGAKLEPLFGLAICEAITGFKIGMKDNDKNEDKKAQGFTQRLSYLQQCVKIVGKGHNNSAAKVFYKKCLIHCKLEQWREAMVSIDQTIERSEENQWEHFYVRSLILAEVHHFSEAINDSCIAISFKPSEPSVYLLRAACYQIQGNGNRAFHDLQTYLGTLGMRPEDKEVHKFAGKLLFQNGAFEDAILAFDHDPIELTPMNTDSIVTKGKTYFLLGRFKEAAASMRAVYQLQHPNKNWIIFDSQMMQLVGDIVLAKEPYRSLRNRIDQQYQKRGLSNPKDQIFKSPDKHTLMATCSFLESDYPSAISSFTLAIKQKQKITLKQALTGGGSQQDVETQARIFNSQMAFNIAITYLAQGEPKQAVQWANKMEVEKQDPIYSEYTSFLSLLQGTYPQGSEIEIRELSVYPNRNKISYFLPYSTITLRGLSYRVRLCIPFPKVEPPDIFPHFDHTMFCFSLEDVDRRPQAPWIQREENTINFTGKIDRVSHPSVEESVKDSEAASQVEQLQSPRVSRVTDSHISISSINERRNLPIPQSAQIMRKKQFH